MEIVILPDADRVARTLADVITARVQSGPCTLGLATGSSPLGAYQELIRRYRAGEVSFRDCWAVLLDEYVGLAPGHEQSYARVIRDEFTGQVDLPPDHVLVPDGSAQDLPAAAAEFERRRHEVGPVAVQVLGIGANGHLGFNEPGSSLGSRTRIKTLTEQTRADNARFFGADETVPVHVLTQGLATILEAEHLVLVATGTGKADAVAAAAEGPLTASCPASVLQLHPHATVVVDEAAAGSLAHADRYRRQLALKPDWQPL